MFNLNNTYKKVKDVFIKPKLKFFFGLWRKDPCLSVYRSGPTIWVFSKHQTCGRWHKDFKEKHPFFTKYFKPRYVLPVWMTFEIFNWDITWKTKYGDYRFEFPGQFTIVFFGLSFSIWNVNPTGNDHKDEDYWEAILWYINSKKETPIEKLKESNSKLGRWVIYTDDGKELVRRLDKDFLKEPYKNFDN